MITSREEAGRAHLPVILLVRLYQVKGKISMQSQAFSACETSLCCLPNSIRPMCLFISITIQNYYSTHV